MRNTRVITVTSHANEVCACDAGTVRREAGGLEASLQRVGTEWLKTRGQWYCMYYIINPVSGLTRQDSAGERAARGRGGHWGRDRPHDMVEPQRTPLISRGAMRLGVILLQEPPGSDCSVVLQDPLLIFSLEKMFPTPQTNSDISG